MPGMGHLWLNPGLAAEEQAQRGLTLPAGSEGRAGPRAGLPEPELSIPNPVPLSLYSHL